MPRKNPAGLRLIDFDPLRQEHEQARKRSWKAFQLLLEQPQLCLILCASGNGYHLFVYTLELHPVGEWIVLFEAGLRMDWSANCGRHLWMLFPNERAESQRPSKIFARLER